jgi:hypothetical protein
MIEFYIMVYTLVELSAKCSAATEFPAPGEKNVDLKFFFDTRIGREVLPVTVSFLSSGQNAWKGS